MFSVPLVGFSLQGLRGSMLHLTDYDAKCFPIPWMMEFCHNSNIQLELYNKLNQQNNFTCIITFVLRETHSQEARL